MSTRTTLHSSVVKTTRRSAEQFNLTVWIFGALFAGLSVGLFLGEYAANLKFLGDIYIGLMQMTVLPFIVFSLVGNIGRLSLSELRLLTGSALLIYAAMWAVAALTVLLIAGSFPELETSRFFSSSMVDPPPNLDLLNLFIPSNPFHSLANNAVPAVVIFCILFGVGIIGCEDKTSLLKHIGLVARTLHRVNGMVVRLTPVGVFGIAANAAGTMTLEEFERLQGYYLGFGAAVMVLTLGVLPLLVTSCTPLRYRQVMGAARSGVLTAFVTGSVLAVIPLLIDSVQSLLANARNATPEHPDYPEFILPLAYPFPNSGNVVALLFIPFAAWFIGDPLTLGNELTLLGLGFFLMFGKVFLAIPFLLNTFQIPQDMFQLFLASGVLAGRLGDALSGMHYLVFTTLAAAAMTGLLRIHWRRLVLNFGLMAAILGATVLGLNALLRQIAEPDPTPQQMLSRTPLIAVVSGTVTQVAPGANPLPLVPGQNRLQRIGQRGVIRVGYVPDQLPYSYTNDSGALVGFDIDLVIKLAVELQVGIEWVPYQRATLEEQLAEDQFDLAVSGLTVSLQRSSRMLMTQAYLVVNSGLVVRDHRRDEFASEARIANRPGLRLGVSPGGFSEQSMKEHFPQATLVLLDSPRDFFTGKGPPLDALAIQAESGAAWTLVYPAFSVVNPFHHRDSVPVAMAVAGFDAILGDTLNTWITLQKMNGTLDRLFDYWIQGKETLRQHPRWSILRNLLRWVSERNAPDATPARHT